MTTTHPRVADYASGYERGRRAAKEHASAADNPYHPRTSAFHGWNDGHFDERSARSVAIERHSAFLWTAGDAN